MATVEETTQYAVISYDGDILAGDGRVADPRSSSAMRQEYWPADRNAALGLLSRVETRLSEMGATSTGFEIVSRKVTVIVGDFEFEHDKVK